MKIKKSMSELREMASRKFFEAFGKAPIIVTQYGEVGACAQCVWPDGVKEYMQIAYEDLVPESQHDKAMAYIKTII